MNGRVLVDSDKPFRTSDLVRKKTTLGARRRHCRQPTAGDGAKSAGGRTAPVAADIGSGRGEEGGGRAPPTGPPPRDRAPNRKCGEDRGRTRRPSWGPIGPLYWLLLNRGFPFFLERAPSSDLDSPAPPAPERLPPQNARTQAKGAAGTPSPAPELLRPFEVTNPGDAEVVLET